MAEIKTKYKYAVSVIHRRKDIPDKYFVWTIEPNYYMYDDAFEKAIGDNSLKSTLLSEIKCLETIGEIHPDLDLLSNPTVGTFVLQIRDDNIVKAFDYKDEDGYTYEELLGIYLTQTKVAMKYNFIALTDAININDELIEMLEGEP